RLVLILILILILRSLPSRLLPFPSSRMFANSLCDPFGCFPHVALSVYSLLQRRECVRTASVAVDFLCGIRRFAAFGAKSKSAKSARRPQTHGGRKRREQRRQRRNTRDHAEMPHGERMAEEGGNGRRDADG